MPYPQKFVADAMLGSLARWLRAIGYDTAYLKNGPDRDVVACALGDNRTILSRDHHFEKMKAVLANGMHMSIYPEGTRNRTSEPLKKFHDGAFKLAVDTGHAIIPAIMLNTKKVLPPGKAFYFWPHKLCAIILHISAPNGGANSH